MNKVIVVVRVLYGLMLVVFGANYFLQFLPQPEMGKEVGAFMVALMSVKFYFPVIKVIEVVAGLAFLINKKVAFAAVLVFPVMVAAFLFHLGLDVAGIGGSAVGLVFNIILLYANREKYLPMWK
jgi:uncharacterized membrane protein YphA (DoxX/SURF4 family)